MSFWLYQEIVASDDDREPQLALQSTINWARSLALEIAAQHGDSTNEQFASCLAHFRANTQGGASIPEKRAVFEPLFSSLTNALTIVSQAVDGASRQPPWTVPGLIVSWYYATYTAMRAMLAASGVDAPDTHAGVIKAVGASLRTRLPHPLNMTSSLIRNEEFSKELPDYPGTSSCDLAVAFPGTRTAAREMLLGYLSGTRKREVDAIKERLKRKHSLANFRTNKAKSIRHARLERQEFNFMHCAFRYRGKANYRDAIFIAYGSQDLQHREEFLQSLGVAAKFAFLCALAFVRHRLGSGDSQAFVDDLSRNLRGVQVAKPEELFWARLAL